MTLEEIRAKYPQYADKSDLDLLMGMHRKFYPDMPLKQFIGSIGGADMAYAKGAQSGGWAKDYYEQGISQPMDGETPDQTALRLGGSASGPVGNPGGQGGTALRSGLQGMTFGAGDEIVAGVAGALDPNATYDQYLKAERDKLQLGREQFPKTALGSEIAGAVATPGVAIEAMSKGPLLGRMAAGAGLGATQSAIYGFLSGEGGAKERINSAQGAAKLGALVGGAAPALGSAVKSLYDGLAGSKAISAAAKNAPTTEELRTAGNAAYKAVDDLGVSVTPDAFRTASDDIIGGMQAKGLDEGMGSLTPQSERLAAILRDKAGSNSPISFSDIDLIRRKAGVPAGNMAVKTESALGTGAIEGLDDFVRNLRPDQVASGDAAALPEAINLARDTWSKMSRSQMIDDAISNSENYLSGSASGVRNQLSRILKSPKLSRSFSDAEQDMMRKAISGTIPEKILNMLGGGLGQIATVASGAGLGGLGGAAIGGATALAARKGSEALASRSAEKVRAVIANGGLASAPQLGNDKRAAIEALLRRVGVGAIGQQ